MSPAELLAIARGAPLPLERVNIRLDPDYPPRLRKLTRAQVVKRDGFLWLMWYWEAEHDPQEGSDCGYAGTRGDHALLAGLDLARRP